MDEAAGLFVLPSSLNQQGEGPAGGLRATTADCNGAQRENEAFSRMDGPPLLVGNDGLRRGQEDRDDDGVREEAYLLFAPEVVVLG